MKTLLVALVFVPALASADAVVVTKPGDVKWQPTTALGKGVMSSDVVGDSAKGAATVIVKIAAGTLIKPHTHSATETIVVSSGTVVIGEGTTVDEKKGAKLGAGSWFRVPAKTPHWLKAKSQALLVRYSEGARDVIYVDPKDDPRAAGK